jgi:hypothetical protein
MSKPNQTPLYLLPYLYPGTSSEFWYRRVRDGRLVVTSADDKARNRTTDTKALEAVFGAITEDKYSEALQAYGADRISGRLK